MSEYALQYTGSDVDRLLGLVKDNEEVIKTAGTSIDQLENAVEKLGGKIDAEGSVPLMTTIWSNAEGEWNDVMLEVPTLGSYSIVAIVFNESFCTICYKKNGRLNGGATWLASDGSVCTSHVSFAVAGDIITRNNNHIKHIVLYAGNDDGNTTTDDDEPVITKIIGIC